MSTAAPPFAVNLKAAREHAGLSREQAALAIGRTWSSLAAYERGVVTPPLAVLDRLAEVYGVRLAALVEPAVPDVA